MRWAGKKYKRLRAYRRFTRWWHGVLDRDPELFAHWRWVRTFVVLFNPGTVATTRYRPRGTTIPCPWPSAR
jgi:hypothetical protein